MEWFIDTWQQLAFLGAAVTALVVAVRGQRTINSTISQSREHRVEEVVDADVLAQFLALKDSVSKLEKDLTATKADLAVTKVDLAEALRQLAEMKKVEEYLRARLHEKDKELLGIKQDHLADLASKRDEIDRLRQRVKHLEDVCKRAGINGDPIEEDEQT